DADLRPLRRHDPRACRCRPHPDRPVGCRPRPAGFRRPAPGRLVPGVPQPPDDGDRPAPAADQPHRGGDRRRGGGLRHPSRRVLPRPHARVGGAARRHRRAHRGQVEPRAPRPDRPRHRRLLRPGLARDADARAQQPHASPDQALPRPAHRPAVVHDARSRGRAPIRLLRAGVALPGPGGGHGISLRRAPDRV
ncbi:MAG: Deoxycytidine triphosphate deaminase (dUMP-forming), partial [uncultured Solirubrobacteraceae bacterium]